MQARNVYCILLISLNLAHIVWCKPVSVDEDVCLLKSKYEETQPSDKDNLLTPSTQMLKFTANGLQKLSLKYATDGKRISEQLLKSSEVLNSKSPKILEFKRNLTQFEEQYSACDGLNALFRLAESYSNITSFYYELEEASLDDDSKLILSLLKKHKSEEMDNEFEKFFDIFVQELYKKYDSLNEQLKKEDSTESKQLLDWFAQFKILTNYDDKIVAFEKYFGVY